MNTRFRFMLPEIYLSLSSPFLKRGNDICYPAYKTKVLTLHIKYF